ncbi:SPOR domain-containing protein [bacterium CPR1]|nr:SPOR domain-containing protein [bacterium CPR1]
MVAISMLALATLQAQEASTPDELAILIVGTEENAEMMRQENVLIEEVRRQLRTWPADKRPPVFSYHFNKKKERAYCEQKLNILVEDLVFVGIVRLEKKVPRKVVYRIDRLVNPARSATELLERAQEMLGVNLTPSPSPSPGTPSPSATPSASPSPDEPEARWRIQLGVFGQRKNAEELVAKLREKGHVATIMAAVEEGASVYKVQIGPFANRQEALTAVDALKAQSFQQAFLVDGGGD